MRASIATEACKSAIPSLQILGGLKAALALRRSRVGFHNWSTPCFSCAIAMPICHLLGAGAV
jgi:hypothetical protein